jgi:homoaconitase/3-isopropylmalate dehydratase large subunit
MNVHGSVKIWVSGTDVVLEVFGKSTIQNAEWYDHEHQSEHK